MIICAHLNLDSSAIPRVQMDLALKRIAQLRAQLTTGSDPCVPNSPHVEVGIYLQLLP